jgi:septal ring factor EnvC (AmiA/AmiB activator)
MSISKSTEIIARLKQITATSTDSGLSERLGVSPQTLSSWKGRERMPYSVCIDLAEQHGISLDWLLTGAGPMRRTLECQASPSQADTEQRMLAIFRTLTAADQQFVQQMAQERQRLRDLEQRLDRLYEHAPAVPNT